MFLPLQSTPLWLNLILFTGAVAVVWFAGIRLGHYAKAVAARTKAGEAFIGTLLLGAVVSLPETVVAVTASALGEPKLAVNTLLGGIVFSILILAITDTIVGKEPLTSDIRRPVVPLQGALVILLLAVAAAGISVGDVPILGVGCWSSGLLALYLLTVVLVKQTQQKRAWVVRERLEKDHRSHSSRASNKSSERHSLPHVALLTAAAALAILAAGFVTTLTADVLAQQTGLGASFFGFLLGGIATSLPEVSSTLSAARLRQYEMVFSDAFGTNLFSVMLLFVSDAVYSGEPILNNVGRFSLLGTLLGIAVTSVYVTGLLLRPKRSFFRMGVDSVLVFIMSVAGFLLLYRLR